MTATATKQTRSIIPADFKPGASYEREDGTIMVEIAPGQFINKIVALGLGIRPRPSKRSER